MHLFFYVFCSLSRFFRLLAFLGLSFFLCACVGQTSTNVWDTNETQSLDALAFSDRLFSVDDTKPVFGTTRVPSQLEIIALTDFANRLNGGAFIFGGNPSYLIDITYQEHALIGGNIQQRYTVRWLNARTNDVLSHSQAYGKCRPSDALLTYPPKCSIMQRRVLDAALYAL